MSFGENEFTERKLSKRILKEHRIFIHGYDVDPDEREEWLEKVARDLTCFPSILPRDSVTKFADNLKDFSDDGQDKHLTSAKNGWSLQPSKATYSTERRLFGKPSVLREIDIELELCESISKEATELRQHGALEPDWVFFLRSHLFLKSKQVCLTLNDFDIRIQWQLHENILWNDILPSENSDPDVTPRTKPKPDLTYAFHINDDTPLRAGLIQPHEYDDNFSRVVLAELRTHVDARLFSSTTTKLRKNAQSRMRAADLICFPWAIVEVKASKFDKDGTNNERICYCQAANASAEALRLREQLAEKAGDRYEAKSLAIFALTCVGPSVKLWITHRNKFNDIVMVNMWATSLELVWGVLALRRLVKNMQGWVHDNIRPEISRWIRFIREDLSNKVVVTPSGDSFKQRKRAVSCDPSSQDLQTPLATSNRRNMLKKSSYPARNYHSTVNLTTAAKSTIIPNSSYLSSGPYLSRRASTSNREREVKADEGYASDLSCEIQSGSEDENENEDEDEDESARSSDDDDSDNDCGHSEDYSSNEGSNDDGSNDDGSNDDGSSDDGSSDEDTEEEADSEEEIAWLSRNYHIR